MQQKKLRLDKIIIMPLGQSVKSFFSKIIIIAHTDKNEQSKFHNIIKHSKYQR